MIKKSIFNLYCTFSKRIIIFIKQLMSLTKYIFSKSIPKGLFPSKSKEKSFHSPNISLRNISKDQPIGLSSNGNTSPLNSIIQLLYAASDFREALIAKYGAAKEVSNSKLGKLLGMIFKSLKDKNKSYQTLQRQREILIVMAQKLEQINKKQQRRFQQDELEALMNILNEIENKHPQITKKFDIEYSSKCSCCQFTTQDRVLTYSEVKCTNCLTMKQIRLTRPPKYIIYSNHLNIPAEIIKTQLEQGSNKPFKCIEKARIIFMGKGKQGHYVAQREDEKEKRCFQFNDQLVQNAEGRRNMRGIDSNELILLYELQQLKKGLNMASPIDSSNSLSLHNARLKDLQTTVAIKEDIPIQKVRQQQDPIQKIPLNWVTKIRFVRKYLSNYPSTTLSQLRFIMVRRYSQVCLLNIRRDHQILKEYSDFNQEYNKMKNQPTKDAYLNILAQYLSRKILQMRAAFKIISSHLQKNKLSEAQRFQLRCMANSDQDQMFTIVVYVAM